MSDIDAARQLELTARYNALAEQHEGDADVPDEIEAELAAIEQELDAIGAKERAYRPEDIARAGAIVSLSSDGTLRVERGCLRPEDEAKPETASGREGATDPDGDAGHDGEAAGNAWTSGDRSPEAAEPKAPPSGRSSTGCAGGILPTSALSAALASELEAHRTVGLQAELVRQPELAPRQCRRADWTEGRGASCVAVQVAQAAGLYMRTWWQPTAESYLGRVPKALILEAVRDAAGAKLPRRLRTACEASRGRFGRHGDSDTAGHRRGWSAGREHRRTVPAPARAATSSGVSPLRAWTVTWPIKPSPSRSSDSTKRDRARRPARQCGTTLAAASFQCGCPSV